MKITNIIPQHLESLLSKLQEMGVDMEVDVDSVTIRGGGKLQGSGYQNAAISWVCDRFAAAVIGVAGRRRKGKSTIKETIYPGTV